MSAPPSGNDIYKHWESACPDNTDNILADSDRKIVRIFPEPRRLE